jgi:hypothetical protein
VGIKVARQILPVRKMLIESILMTNWTRIDSGEVKAGVEAYVYAGSLIENCSWITRYEGERRVPVIVSIQLGFFSAAR